MSLWLQVASAAKPDSNIDFEYYPNSIREKKNQSVSIPRALGPTKTIRASNTFSQPCSCTVTCTVTCQGSPRARAHSHKNSDLDLNLRTLYHHKDCPGPAGAWRLRLSLRWSSSGAPSPALHRCSSLKKLPGSWLSYLVSQPGRVRDSAASLSARAAAVAAAHV